MALDELKDAKLIQQLSLLFNHSPTKFSPHPPAESLTLDPLSFYDTHLNAQLALKRVILIPSFPTHLSRSVDRRLKSIVDQAFTLPGITFHSDFPSLKYCKGRQDKERLAMDAQFVGEEYKVFTGHFSSIIASTLSLHPNSPGWAPVVLGTHNRRMVERDYYALDDAYAPKLFINPCIDQGTWDSMDPMIQEDVQEIEKRFKRLATWLFLCINDEAENVLKAMDEFDSAVFSFRKPLTGGYQRANSETLPLVDASMTSWGDSVDSFTRRGRAGQVGRTPIYPTRRSSRILSKNPTQTNPKRATKLKPPTPPARQDQRSTRKIATLPSPENFMHRSLPASLIQHAWVRAAEDDSTFIVFSNGNYERIGFRHRATGTLFLSDLIEVEKCSDPAHGKMSIGLFISIIEDVLDRTRQMVNSQRVNPRSRKRPREPLEDLPPAKRPNTRLHVREEASLSIERKEVFERVFEQAGNRHLALLLIEDGVFYSPAPSSFLRCGHSRRDKIASGATGTAHKAVLELSLANGTSLVTDNVVVKLAFDVEQRKRLRHEFSIYEHLSSSNVKGIPRIVGLFKDIETRTLALVMNNIGTSVVELGPRGSDRRFPIPEPQRDMFIDVLKDIHRAGVRHRDIRPENMAIDDGGGVAIIDFDRADLAASEGSRGRELEHMLDLLNGKYYPPGDQDSLRTDRRSHSSLPSSDDDTT